MPEIRSVDLLDTVRPQVRRLARAPGAQVSAVVALAVLATVPSPGPGVAGCTATGVPAPGPEPSAAALTTLPLISWPSTKGAFRIDSPAAPCSQ